MSTWLLTVDHTKIPETLTDFPMYVPLAAMPPEFWSEVTNGGGDIRCRDALSNPLAREVVSCDTGTDTGELWVKTTLSSATDTVVSISVDGTSTEPAADSTYGSEAVWSNGYVGVWHLDASFDSSTDGLTLGTLGTVTHDDGIIGQGVDVTAATQQALRDSGVVMNLNTMSGSGWTVRVWAKNTATSGDHKFLWGFGQYVEGYGIRCNGTNWYALDARSGANGFGSAPVGAGWEMLTLVWDSDGQFRFFHGGTLVASKDLGWRITGTSGSTGGPLTFGRQAKAQNSTNRYFRGYMDEIAVSDTPRSAAWIATEYLNQFASPLLYTITSDTTTSPIKVWDGANWTPAPAKVWDGAAWTPAATKVWDGTSWA